MPLGYFSRVSFILVAVYMTVLVFFHHLGLFSPRVSSELRPCLGHFEAGFEVLATTPAKEGWGGWAFEGEIVGYGSGQRLLTRFPKNFPMKDVRPGDYVFLSGKLERPRGPRNPGDFDVRGFLADRGIEFILTGFSIDIMGRSLNPRWILLAWAAGLRKSIQDSFRKYLNPLDARLLSGMVLGLKGRLPRKLNRSIQDAGVMHLLVPSGTKVALVLAGIWLFCYALSLRPISRFICCVGGGGFYTLAVGGDPPYFRALCAALILELGLRLGRDAVPFQALVLSAWLSLLLNPLALFSMGFQMSYLATFGLIVAMPSFEKFWPAFLPPWALALIRMGLATGIVEILLWPIFALGFGRAPFLGALANIVLLPFAALFMAGGFLLWALSSARFLTLSFLCAWGIKKWLLVFCAICRLFARLPFAALELSHWSAAYVAVYYLAAGAFLVIPRLKVSLLLAALAFLFGVSNFYLNQINAPKLSVLYLSLSRGEAAIVSERGEAPVLILKGSSSGPIIGVLRAEGIRFLKKVVILGNDPIGFRAIEGLSARVGISAIVVEKKSFKICQGHVCLSFGPPGVQRGEEKFDIIDSLRHRAVEVATNGDWIKIKAEN
jgi:competence protein ComEC